jgi:hypothetical protein
LSKLDSETKNRLPFAHDTSVAVALSSLSGAYNTAYTAHFVRPNFGFAETSYMLGTLSAMPQEDEI